MSKSAAAADKLPDATISMEICDWAARTEFNDLPHDIVEASRLRLIDVIGLVLMARTTDVGRALLGGIRTLGGPPEASLIGEGRAVGMATAAFANGAMAEAIEFDDTHNETIVHVGAAIVAAALAAGEAAASDGRALLSAIAVGSEAVCRLALIAPGAFHPRGFHPTGIFCGFGAAIAAGKLLGLSADQLVAALGIVGSQASGLLECWSDGSWTKVMHPGWAAHGAIAAVRLAQAGFTGPAQVFEGGAGLFSSHVQGEHEAFDFLRAVDRLGEDWEARNISFKPYPNAHILHGLIEVALEASPQIQGREIGRVECAVAPHWVPIVCEPMSKKRRPSNSAAARISLYHCIAEALLTGRSDARSYDREMLSDPRIAQLADQVVYVIRRDWSDRSAFPGEIRIELTDGEIITKQVTTNIGGATRPLDRQAVVSKFRTNAALVLRDSRLQELEAIVFAQADDLTARAVAAACVIEGRHKNEL